MIDYLIDVMSMFILGGLLLMLFYAYTRMRNKRLLRMLNRRKNCSSKRVWRLYVFEALYALSTIDEQKADAVINKLIHRFGMGGLRWGHLNWAYDQVISQGSINYSTMPNKNGASTK